MKPDRSNYEFWIIDWLDGNLTEEQAAIFESFLADNPDLLEEAEMAANSKLSPQDINMENKNRLLREVTELPASQFEHLSVAFLENDITTEETRELNMILESDPEKKVLFDTIQKTKLQVQAQHQYNYKDKLLRKEKYFTIGTRQRIWLSSAAAVAVLVVSYFLLPGNNNSLISEETIEDLSSGTREEIVFQKIAFSDPADGNKLLEENQKSEPRINFTAELPEQISTTELTAARPVNDYIQGMLTEAGKVEVIKPYRPAYDHVSLSLTALNIEVPDFENDYDGTRLARFISRNFREKILKEENPGMDPLKPYELAEAGIEGLNKLFGWEMALVQNTDEEGELQSVYFSSKILKFNSPVKKVTPAP
jgi:hypothetical protein